jgi:hypothetical protein
LVVATAHLPYGYYTFLRVMTCGIAAYIAVHDFQDEKTTGKLLAFPMALIAVLWNPIFPIYLHRSTWFYLDLGAAVFFVLHYIFVRSAFWVSTGKLPPHQQQG